MAVEYNVWWRKATTKLLSLFVDNPVFVLFKKESDGAVVAIFMDEWYNYDLYGDKMMSCYTTMGQHGPASIEYIEEQPPATKDEHAYLLRGLRGIGYFPIPVYQSIYVKMYCPLCGERHIDSGVWRNQPHSKHLCNICGNVWSELKYKTIGI